MPGMTRYAKALLGLAQEQQAAETVGAALTQVAQILADPTLAKILSLPTVSPKIRKDIAEQLVQALAPNPLVGNFLRVLAENDRLKDFPTIEKSYRQLLERTLGRVRARIRVAAPLSDAELQSLVEAFGRLTQKTVVPTVEVDPALLGGAVVEIEGRVHDASLKTQLEKIGASLAQQL